MVDAWIVVGRELIQLYLKICLHVALVATSTLILFCEALHPWGLSSKSINSSIYRPPASGGAPTGPRSELVYICVCVCVCVCVLG